MYNFRYCSVVFEEYEIKSGDSSLLYIVIDIRDSDMEKFFDGFVVIGISKGEGDGEYIIILEDGILDILLVLGKGWKFEKFILFFVNFWIIGFVVFFWLYIKNVIFIVKFWIIFLCWVFFV